MINKVILEGRIANEIEPKKTQNDLSVVQFTLAVNRKVKKDAEADFINCVAWRQSADFLGQYAAKGDLLGVVGHLSTRSYEGKNGKVFVTEVTCEEVNLLAKKQAQNTPQSNDGFRPQTYGEYTGRKQENENGTIVIDQDALPFY